MTEPSIKVKDTIKEKKKNDLKYKLLLDISNLQNELEKLYSRLNLTNDSDIINFNIQKEIAEYEYLKLNNNDTKLENLYPSLNDPNFNIKIAEKKEFYDIKYDDKVYDVKEQSEILCNAEFELSPHQLFVRNFLSFHTPYNSLLLYHGLGTGKTCSAIGVAEEMRDYMKQMGISKKIIVVASPNVQDNFKLQLFDDRKLKEIDGLWNLKACTGNRFLREINPRNMKGLNKDRVINQIKKIINDSYLFMGYIEFANFIEKTYNSKKEREGETDKLINERMRKVLIKENLKKVFGGSLIIIDEVHNIRNTDDNRDKRVSTELIKLVENVENLRLLLLSATPMYNNYKEIIWLLNLMNLNDRRPLINSKDVFNQDGTFVTDENGNEIGKELLQRKSIGYISFVKGDNPYIFPFRIWPNSFEPEKSIKNESYLYPRIQLNEKPILDSINKIDIYMCEVGEYQEQGYKYIMDTLKNDDKSLENMESLGYSLLQRPIQALNIIYPNSRFDTILQGEDIILDIGDMVGSNGLNNIMSYTEITSPPQKKDYQYKTMQYGRIFSPSEIGKYSGKIKSICNSILNSEGIVLIYSEYIDGGLVPIILALEEIGFTRYGNTSSVFKEQPTKPIDSIQFKPINQIESGTKFNPAKYCMITGDKYFSPDNVKDIKALTSPDNINGEKIKVVLISQAGAEGIDFKFIRQVHIMEPWYNMNRIEQIIGRGVRNCSHKDLPFNKRNVSIYLYGSKFIDYEKESADLYIYRYAEKKAIQIGNISRILKENSIDCLLNNEAMNYSVEKLNQKEDILLSNNKIIEYLIGEKSYDVTCDYMETCLYKCNPGVSLSDLDIKEPNLNTYNETFIFMNIDKITNRIKQLFKDKFFYKKSDLISEINIIREYPIIQINAALNQLIEDNGEYLSDKYGRMGKLINIDNYYLFQPLELSSNNVSLFERSVPLNYKHNNLLFDLSKSESSNKLIEDESGFVVRDEESRKTIKNIGELEEYKYGEEEYKEEEKLEIDSEDREKQLKRKKETTLINLQKKDLNELILEIEENYENAMNKQILMRGEEDWYKYYSLVSEKLIKEGEFNDDDIKLFLLKHILESLDFNKKILLFNYLYTTDDDKLSIALKELKNLIDSEINTVNNIKGIIIYKDNNKPYPIQLIVFRNNKWEIAEPEDLIDFQNVIKSKNVKVTELNNIVGFITTFKNNYMVFKVKNMELKRHIGARCDQAGKIDSIKLLNAIINDDKYDEENTKQINKKEICIRQEMYLRLYDNIRKNGKRWYLDPVEVVVSNLEKISFNK